MLLQIWARQLLNEHRSICYCYGLKLSQPAIEVVEVSSYLGKWIPKTRTISLSRSLIEEQPWEVVLNVLKHEMAHQYISDIDGTRSGHGADFKNICEKLGVPPSFQKSQNSLVNLGEPTPDQETAESVKTLEKVRKLLALSASSNEHEALMAMQKARQLLDKYNLNDTDILDKATPTCSSILILLKRKRVESYHRAICSLLIDYFQIKIVITPFYDAQDLTTYKCIDIMGKSNNVKIASYVYHFLMERLPSLWTRYQTKNQSHKRGRNSYWLGVLNGFREGLNNGIPGGINRNEGIEPRARIQVPVKIADQALEKFIVNRYPKLRNGRRSKTRVDPGRFEAGLAEGRKLKLAKGLNQEGAKQILLIH